MTCPEDSSVQNLSNTLLRHPMNSEGEVINILLRTEHLTVVILSILNSHAFLCSPFLLQREASLIYAAYYLSYIDSLLWCRPHIQSETG